MEEKEPCLSSHQPFKIFPPGFLNAFLLKAYSTSSWAYFSALPKTWGKSGLIRKSFSLFRI